MTALFEVSAADVADTSDDYYTPRWIFDAAGLLFDMDVAAPLDPSRRTCPARRYLTPVEDGLNQPWEGLVWMNPPYSKPRRWIERFAEHRAGLALLPAARDTAWLGTLMHCADAITLLSVHFGRPDGSVAGCRFSLILAACGEIAVDALSRVAAADRCIRGAYHVRPGMSQR
jgi:hypothetical protein